MAAYLSKSFLKQSFNIPSPNITEENLPRQDGRVWIVTGGYAGVGYQLSRILFAKGAIIYIAGRSQEKGTAAIATLTESAGTETGKLHLLLLDLNDLSTIKHAVDEFLSKESRLDVLVNNAGVMFPPLNSKTKQGHDLQFGTNCLGPFLFTKLLIPTIVKTAQSTPRNSVRILWAGSAGIQVLSPKGGVRFNDKQPIVGTNQQENYGQTKVGNLLLAIEMQGQLSEAGVVSVAFNPGNLRTELQRHSGGILLRLADTMLHPAIFGAYTELYAATSDQVTLEKKVTYVIPWGRNGSDLVRKDIQIAIEGGLTQKFWAWCETETNPYL